MYIKSLTEKLLDIIYPPRCLVCNEEVAKNHSICADCWKAIDFITEPFCNICGNPFEFEISKNAICASCAKSKPNFKQARALFAYNNAGQKMITAFKFKDQTNLAIRFSQWINDNYKHIINKTDFVIPVPISRWRLIKRRYNQSALITYYLKKNYGHNVRNDLLIKIKNTKPQTGLSSQQRQKNVAGAFAIKQKYANFIKGKKITLIDDVYTTGSTIKSCVRTLYKHGAESVYVITIAKTVRK